MIFTHFKDSLTYLDCVEIYVKRRENTSAANHPVLKDSAGTFNLLYYINIHFHIDNPINYMYNYY